MTDWLSNELQEHLARLESAGMRRRLIEADSAGVRVRMGGRTLVNFASNDYLGLTQHEHLKASACRAIEALGNGAGASRLVCGHLALHEQVERAFARFKHPDGCEGPGGVGAMLLPTGYMANLAVLGALAGRGDLICLDKLNHASLIDAARLTGAQVRTFGHLHTDKAARLLERHFQASTRGGVEADRERMPRRFIVTDAVFSMDGDVADLPALCALAERYKAVMVVDEAHGTGVLGARGSGLCEAQGVSDRVDVVVSTASKALGCLGGVITAARPIVETIVNHARPMIYSTAVAPGQAAAIGAALEVVVSEPTRRQRLLTMSEHVRSELSAMGWRLPTTAMATPILPLIVGDASGALSLAGHLQERGILAVAIRPPTVARGQARVRLTLRADLEEADLDRLFEALRAYRGVRSGAGL